MPRAVWAAGLLGAGLAAVFSPVAQAHPHGALDCAVRVNVAQGRLAWIEQRLTLDAANTEALAARLQLDAAVPDQAARVFRGVLEGLFRQSGWMVQARAAAGTEPLVLDDPDAATWSRGADGRATVAARLQPASAGGLADGLRIACADPSWYWAAGFAGTDALQVRGADCSARIGPATALAEQAQALRAAAQQAGSAGADQMQAGLLQPGVLRSASAVVHC